MPFKGTGQICNCCHPNALITLAEYLEDYATPKTKELGYKLIENQINKITNKKVLKTTKENISNIKNSNARDFRF